MRAMRLLITMAVAAILIQHSDGADPLEVVSDALMNLRWAQFLSHFTEIFRYLSEYISKPK